MRGLGFSGGVELWERELRGEAALKGKTDRLDRPIRALGIWPVRCGCFLFISGVAAFATCVFESESKIGKGSWSFSP